MATKVSKTPPIDTGSEMKTASLTLTRIRALLTKSELPGVWQHWVIDSVQAGLPVLDEDAGTP